VQWLFDALEKALGPRAAALATIKGSGEPRP
jgi:hypothetical protein